MTAVPSHSATRPTPGNAFEISRGVANVPRPSRCRSMIVRAAGSSVSITIRLIPTPSPATTPKSPIAPIGENRLASRLTTVVAAANPKGMVTFCSPVRTASITDSPATRCSR